MLISTASCHLYISSNFSISLRNLIIFTTSQSIPSSVLMSPWIFYFFLLSLLILLIMRHCYCGLYLITDNSQATLSALLHHKNSHKILCNFKFCLSSAHFGYLIGQCSSISGHLGWYFSRKCLIIFSAVCIVHFYILIAHKSIFCVLFSLILYCL